MKITPKSVRPPLKNIGSVQFGAIFRLHERPDYWPTYYRRFNVKELTWMLSSEYYRDYHPRNVTEGDQQLLIINMEDGSGIGLKLDAFVEEVLPRGEVMKITKGPCQVRTTPLSTFSQGTPFRFLNKLASKHYADDIFIRAEVCSSYRPRDHRGTEKYTDKLPVINLRTGALAYVDACRQCLDVDAEVCVSE